MSFASFIAHRIYGRRAQSEQRMSRPAIQIATAGIAVGLLTMVVSLAVVRGFKQEVSSKVRGFMADAQVLSMTRDQYFNVLPVMANDSLLQVIRSVRGVRHVQPFAYMPGMLKTETDFGALQIKGVDESYDTLFLSRNLVEGRLPRFSSSQPSNEILLSGPQSRDLSLKVGDRVFAYFFTGLTTPPNGDLTVGGGGEQLSVQSPAAASPLRVRRFTVCGIFETHLAEYDRMVCFTDLYTVRRLNSWKEGDNTGLEIFFNQTEDDEATLGQLVQRINHTTDLRGTRRGAFSVRELSPRIFAWLDVLDTNVVMIIALMLLIGAFTVVSSLLIVMLERIRMIALLKALGATDGQIRGIFRRFSFYLVGRAMLIGDLLAVALCFAQQKFHLIPLNASTYYIDSVPISFSWIAFLLVNVGVLFLSLLVIFGASHLMSIGSPARTLTWD